MEGTTSRRLLSKPRRCGGAGQSRDEPTLLSYPQPGILPCMGGGKPHGPRQAGLGAGSQHTPPTPDRTKAPQHPACSSPCPGWPQGTPRGDARSPAPAPAPRTRQSCSHQVPEHAQHQGETHQHAATCRGNGSSMWRRWHRLDMQDVAQTKPGKTQLEHHRSGVLRLLCCCLIHMQVCTRRRPHCCIAAPAPRCDCTAAEVPWQWVAARWWTSQWGDLQGPGNIPRLARVGKRYRQHRTHPRTGIRGREQQGAH